MITCRHKEDVLQSVEHAINSDSTGKFSVLGNEQLSLREMNSFIARAAHTSIENVKTKSYYGLTDFVEEFFSGLAHDKNMVRVDDYCLVENG